MTCRPIWLATPRLLNHLDHERVRAEADRTPATSSSSPPTTYLNVWTKSVASGNSSEDVEALRQQRGQIQSLEQHWTHVE